VWVAKDWHDNRPLDRALALLNPLLRRAALVVEGVDTLGRPRQVGHDETNAWIKLARMPLDPGHDTARLCPAVRPVVEAGIVPADPTAQCLEAARDGARRQHLPRRHKPGDALLLDDAVIAVLDEIADQPARARGCLVVMVGEYSTAACWRL
jgi:hypothetical protein